VNVATPKLHPEECSVKKNKSSHSRARTTSTAKSRASGPRERISPRGETHFIRRDATSVIKDIFKDAGASDISSAGEEAAPEVEVNVPKSRRPANV
jgi:hypothetical protein